MHTTGVLHSADFDINVDGQASQIEAIFPGFNQQDRLGVVVRDTGGSLGASTMIFSFATYFYDFHREKLGSEPGQLWIYPEMFVFHVGQRHMMHAALDVWPRHKEVDVMDEPEQILRAINDRGITRLLVQDRTPVQTHAYNKAVAEEQIDELAANYMQETVSSAEHRIRTVLAYSPSGRTSGAQIEIKSCEQAERYVRYSIDHFESLTDHSRKALHDVRHSLLTEDQRVMESFRRVTLPDALGMLANSTQLAEDTKQYLIRKK